VIVCVRCVYVCNSDHARSAALTDQLLCLLRDCFYLYVFTKHHTFWPCAINTVTTRQGGLQV